MNVLFKNIRVLNPIQNIDQVTNLWIKDGIIKRFSNDEISIDTSTSVIDAKDLVCAPGFFDMHVHLREPGEEHKEDINSGTLAAVNGGFTGICCMPNTTPAIDNAQIMEFVKQKSKDNIVDVYISAALTKNREGKFLTEMYELADNGAVMFTDDGSCVTNSEIMRRIFDYSSQRDLLIAQHCEDTSLTNSFSCNEGYWSEKLGLKGYPSVAEEIILVRDLLLANYCGNRRYHAMHISTKNSVEMIRHFKKTGLRVSCEVTPHHILLTDNYLNSYDTNLKMNPPLRTEKDKEALIEGLIDGTIDCIASDHAPHSTREKDVEFENAPNGIIGLETSLGIVLTYLYHKEKLTLDKIIEKMSINPRKILNLDPIIINENVSANLTIFSPDEEWIVDVSKFKSKSINTPFNGIKLKGKPKYVINNNKFFECNL